MSAKGIIYKADGTTEGFTSAEDSPSLKELQTIVGGKIKFIFLAKGDVLVVKEDVHKDVELLENVQATKLLMEDGQKGFITGNVLLMKSDLL